MALLGTKSKLNTNLDVLIISILELFFSNLGTEEKKLGTAFSIIFFVSLGITFGAFWVEIGDFGDSFGDLEDFEDFEGDLGDLGVAMGDFGERRVSLRSSGSGVWSFRF